VKGHVDDCISPELILPAAVRKPKGTLIFYNLELRVSIYQNNIGDIISNQ